MLNVSLIYEHMLRNTPRGVYHFKSSGHRQKMSVVDSGVSFFRVYFISILRSQYYAQALGLVFMLLDLLSPRAGSAYCVYS
jgi:hypothetical protein